MHFNTPTLLLAAPRWILILGGACIMFLGQMLWAFFAIWVIGPVPSVASPLDKYSSSVLLIGGVVFMPFVETFAGQWLPIRLARHFLAAQWWVAGLVSAFVFTLLHGFTDRFTVNILIGAIVLSAIFVIEAKRHGTPVLSTYLTHALANSMVFCLQTL